MNSKRVEEIKRGLGGWDTAELLEIWNTNDRKSYSDEAFEAIRSILIERGVAIPQQSVYVPMEEKNKSSNSKKTAIILLCVGIAEILFCALLFFCTDNIWEPEAIPIWLIITIGVVTGAPLIVTGIILFFIGMGRDTKRMEHPCETGLEQLQGCSAFAVASLVFDVCGIPCLFYISFFSSFFGLIGIVLAVIALVKLRKNPSLSGRGVAIAGLILGIIVLFAEPIMWGIMILT